MNYEAGLTVNPAKLYACATKLQLHIPNEICRHSYYSALANGVAT